MTGLMKLFPLALCAALAGCAAPAAHAGHGAGEWRLAANQCPDLVEDRRDRRITWSRADAREDLRDARVVRCPARAVYWAPARGARGLPAPRHPGAVVVRYRPNGVYMVDTARGAGPHIRIVARIHRE